MTLSALLVPTHIQMLRALSAWLDRAAEAGADMPDLLAQRLAPDMFPLATQVRFACLQAQEPGFRLRGSQMPTALEALAAEGRSLDQQRDSLDAAQACIHTTIAALEALPATLVDGTETTPVTLALPNGMVFDMAGASYVRDWALPQFYFHIMTAYAILRSQGIALGKPDYVAHMFAYLRPGSLPES